MSDRHAEGRVFYAPPYLLWLVAALIGVHGVVDWLAMRDTALLGYALIPVRVSALEWGGFVTLISYNFLHADWEHVVLNAAWLLAFGTPLARRLGAIRFLLLFFVGSAAGAVVHILTSGAAAALIPVIGASGGVSAVTGAAARFIFTDSPHRLLSLRASFTHRPSALFILIWAAANILSAAIVSGDVIAIAWRVHLGGFIAGILLMSLLDPPPLSPSGGPGNVDYGGWIEKR